MCDGNLDCMFENKGNNKICPPLLFDVASISALILTYPLFNLIISKLPLNAEPFETIVLFSISKLIQ